MEILSTRTLRFNEAYTVHFVQFTVYDSVTVTVQYSIINGTLIDPRTEIQ